MRLVGVCDARAFGRLGAILAGEKRDPYPG